MNDRIGYSARRKTREEERAGSGSDCEREINRRERRKNCICRGTDFDVNAWERKLRIAVTNCYSSLSPPLSLYLSISISFCLTFKAAYIRSEMPSAPLIDLISFRVSAFGRMKEGERLSERKKKNHVGF